MGKNPPREGNPTRSKASCPRNFHLLLYGISSFYDWEISQFPKNEISLFRQGVVRFTVMSVLRLFWILPVLILVQVIRLYLPSASIPLLLVFEMMFSFRIVIPHSQLFYEVHVHVLQFFKLNLILSLVLRIKNPLLT